MQISLRALIHMSLGAANGGCASMRENSHEEPAGMRKRSQCGHDIGKYRGTYNVWKQQRYEEGRGSGWSGWGGEGLARGTNIRVTMGWRVGWQRVTAGLTVCVGRRGSWGGLEIGVRKTDGCTDGARSDK